MNASCSWKMPLALVAAVAMLVGTSSALAGSLVALPYVTNAQTSEVKTSTFPTSITPDGVYVGGVAGVGFTSGGTSFFDTGFVWSAANGPVHVVAGGYQDSVNGIGYRYPAGGGPTEIVVGGGNGGTKSQSMNASTDGGLTWAKRRRTANIGEFGYNTVPGGDGSNDAIFSTYKTFNSSTPQLYVDQWSGGSPGAFGTLDTKGTTTASNIRGVSNTGIAVGDRVSGGVVSNYVLTYNGTGGLTATFTAGLDGTNAGELWDIADDGSWAGGASPHPTKSGLWAYVRDMTSGSVYELPTADPNAAHDTNSRVYGMGPNGDYAVGMDYTAAAVEKAVLWDISAADPNDWTVLDLTQWASDNGILGAFDGNLRRAIAMGISTNPGEPVITGVGYASSLEANGWTGFVLVIPEPATVTLLALGGLSLILRRRRR